MSKLKLIGKNILVGITYLDESGDVEKQIELHGKIITVTKSCLIQKRNDNVNTCHPRAGALLSG